MRKLNGRQDNQLAAQKDFTLGQPVTEFKQYNRHDR